MKQTRRSPDLSDDPCSLFDFAVGDLVRINYEESTLYHKLGCIIEVIPEKAPGASSLGYCRLLVDNNQCLFRVDDLILVEKNIDRKV